MDKTYMKRKLMFKSFLNTKYKKPTFLESEGKFFNHFNLFNSVLPSEEGCLANPSSFFIFMSTLDLFLDNNVCIFAK